MLEFDTMCGGKNGCNKQVYERESELFLWIKKNEKDQSLQKAVIGVSTRGIICMDLKLANGNSR